MVYRKGTRKGPDTPLLLEGYGAYGSPSGAYFSSSQISLLDRGFIYAQAHVRGGGDLGETWYEAGKMKQKSNTFADFIACADMLVEKGFTSRGKLAITGGSAGGLLIGAALNLRPDLCHAALVYVPFVDVVNTMLDESIPLTTEDFTEWGNPKIAEQYAWIRSYSPYDNVEAKSYPAMLVRTSLNDSQVPYWEPAKWVARLRAMKKDRNPLLFKIDLSSGHGGSSGRYDAITDLAFDFAFLLRALGVK
jgi:oligopeptidase B